MINKWMKPLISGLLTVVLAATPLAARPAQASAPQQSPIAEHIDVDAINPDYVDWVANGQKGLAPSAQDFSYLANSYAQQQARAPQYAVHGAAALPAAFDLREYGLVDRVYDQGSSGICWSIAANSAAAGSLKKKMPQLALSATHTAWFCYTGDEESEFAPHTSAYLSGGNDGRAVATMAAWKGPVTADKAPLLSRSFVPLNDNLRHQADYHLQDAYYMPTGIYFDVLQDTHIAVDITKRLLMDVGPVSLNYYSHGTNSYNPDTFAWYNSITRRSDHAVLVVGWDDHFSKNNFVAGNQPKHDGAWLVRNSWGTNWGNDGYFWISYEDKSLVSGNAYLLETADNYTRNYQYDTNGWAYSINTDWDMPTEATAANIFTAKGTEQLEAVSFYTTDAGTSYDISVYTGVNEGQPQSGTKVLSSQKGTEAYAGYHTIELKNPIKLNRGERFSIVITFKNPHYPNPVAIEWCPMPDIQSVPRYMGHGGESYVLKEGTWQDVAGHTGTGYYVTNVCIKGFTNPLPASGTAISTVRFSEPEGPVANNTALTLHAQGDATIYWSNGGSYKPYTGPIALDALKSDQDRMTISAYAQKNGKRGNTISKTYTRAQAQLTDLSLKIDGKTQHLNIANDADRIISLPPHVTKVQVMAQSGDKITINDQAVASTEWSQDIAVPAEQSTTVLVTVTAPNKSTGTYPITLHHSGNSPAGPGAMLVHPILLDSTPQNGSVDIQPTSATKGSIVTLTITPDKGYELDALRLTDESGNKIESRALGHCRYAVIMPNSPLHVTATFGERPADAPPFSDVHSEAWYYKAVKYVYDTHLMMGIDDTTFAPDAPVTRAMVWAVLARQSNAQLNTGSEWYSGAQEWAVKNGVSDGLNPLNNVTREELITMIHRYSHSPAGFESLSHFTDTDTISPWAKEAMVWGVDVGLLSGMDNHTLAPRSGATRAQLASILMRYIENIAK